MTHFICKLLYQQMYFIDFGQHAVLAPDEVVFALDGSDDGSDLATSGMALVSDTAGGSDAGAGGSARPPTGAAALRERVAGAKGAIDGMLSGGVDGTCG